jgi:hypothetical protein
VPAKSVQRSTSHRRRCPLHFNVLKQSDLMRTERRDQYIVYSLDSPVFEDLARMLMDVFPAKSNSAGK